MNCTGIRLESLSSSISPLYDIVYKLVLGLDHTDSIYYRQEGIFKLISPLVIDWFIYWSVSSLCCSILIELSSALCCTFRIKTAYEALVDHHLIPYMLRLINLTFERRVSFISILLNNGRHLKGRLVKMINFWQMHLHI